MPRRPKGLSDKVFEAPLANVYEGGRICGGSVNWPADIDKIPDTFMRSFFTRHLGKGLSKKYPGDITKLWAELDKKDKKEFPLSDLISHGTVLDLMNMRIS
jgi:hypothetical protein